MDASLAHANGIREDGSLDPKFFKKIEEDLLRVTEMYRLSKHDIEEAQKSFGASREKAEDKLLDVNIRPYEVAETVRVNVDASGQRSPQLTPEKTIEHERDLRVVEELMKQIMVHGTTGDVKLDQTVRYMYGKLQELVRVREEENCINTDPSKTTSPNNKHEDRPWSFRLVKEGAEELAGDT